MQTKHYFSYLKETMQHQWLYPCMLTIDSNNHAYTYQSLFHTIQRLHEQFRAIGIQPGDKVAIVGRNSANWGATFLAITSYRAVAVSILPDFTADDICQLVAHSDTKLVFTGSIVRKKIEGHALPNVLGVVDLDTLSMYEAADSQTQQLFNTTRRRHAETIRPEGDILEQFFPTDNWDDTALINYTSGSTGNPKGVMLSFMNLSQNVDFAVHAIPHRPGDRILSILPIAHMFGLMFEFLYPICEGTQIYFLTTQPTPSMLIKAFAEVHPYMILTVPLVIEKIIRKSVFPVIHKPIMRLLWHTPGIKHILRKKVGDKLMTVFGGELRHLIIGGAALNQDVERCLQQIGIPYCVGYGMTECAPLMAYSPWETYKEHSCGRAITNMEFRIDSNDAEHIDGEVQVRGLCVMQGYYKNPTATKEAFTDDGWMRTGDLGVMDQEGNLFLRGRSKNMILGANGQNIYPEEIEDKLNSMPYVAESIVIERNGKLIALVLPDYQSPLNRRQLKTRMEGHQRTLNRHLPAYSQVAGIELVEKEFEKTPKKSIKRFLYK